MRNITRTLAPCGRGVLWAAGIGTTDVVAGRAATDTTLFRIGSTSKAFVPLLVLMMEQEGRLTLEDPVWAHGPELAFRNKWEDTDPIRIVHLLSTPPAGTTGPCAPTR